MSFCPHSPLFREWHKANEKLLFYILVFSGTIQFRTGTFLKEKSNFRWIKDLCNWRMWPDRYVHVCVWVCERERDGGRNLFSFQNVLEDLFAMDERDVRNYWVLQQNCRNILLTCLMKELLFGCPLGIFTWSQWHIFEYKLTLSRIFYWY